MQRSKTYRAAEQSFDKDELYAPLAAIRVAKTASKKKFDETVEVALRLGVDPRKADQLVRGTVNLPNGTGKTARVLVIANGDKAEAAREAGADFVGSDDMIEKIAGGWTDFDAVVATPDLMGKVGRLGKVLGPRGLMPNPKTGTVTMDTAKAVSDIKGGKIEFRVDKHANLHFIIGKASFDEVKLAENYAAALEEILRLKPASSKGRYIRAARPKVPRSGRPAQVQSSDLEVHRSPRPGPAPGAFVISLRTGRGGLVRIREGDPMARPEKQAAVAELVDSFNASAGAVLTEYRGLTVKELQDLRRALGEHATYAVVKNTLTKIAASEAGIDGFDDLLNGPTAIAFINGDVVEAAKGLRDFAKANPTLVIKGGYLDGKALDAKEVAKLADLESRDVLMGKLAGAMLASLSQAVYLLNAPIAQAALLRASRKQAVQEGRTRCPLHPEWCRRGRSRCRGRSGRRGGCPRRRDRGPGRGPRRRGRRRGDRVHRGLTTRSAPTYTT